MCLYDILAESCQGQVSHVSPLRFLSFFYFKKVPYVKKEHKGKKKHIKQRLYFLMLVLVLLMIHLCLISFYKNIKYNIVTLLI